LGDALLESFPCFIVTAAIAAALQKGKLNGFRLAPVDISKSETFQELYGDKDLPSFKWLQVDGVAGNQDFGLSKNHTLVVSETALETLRQFGIQNCEIREWHG
jgi:hypothetical protein